MRIQTVKGSRTGILPSFRVFILFLLSAYSCVFLFSPVVHTHAGHGHVLHQAETCKKDPCHISIYHNRAKGACSHKHHFTPSDDNCFWCDFHLVHQMTVDMNAVGEGVPEPDRTLFLFSVSPRGEQSFFSRGRGPPQKSS